uniref:anoctamin-9-like isoform X2 n=1 Tax=Pristiophorus japonicus TaxID=55135 RepID=UPI00398F35D7
MALEGEQTLASREDQMLETEERAGPMTEGPVEPSTKEGPEHGTEEAPDTSTLSSIQAKFNSRIKKGTVIIKMHRLNRIGNLKMQPIMKWDREHYTMNDETTCIVIDNEEAHLLPEDKGYLDKVDFVLVTRKLDIGIGRNDANRRLYLRNLREKGFNIVKKEDDFSLFFGIQAPDMMFETYIQLLDIAERTSSHTGLDTISNSTRIRIIHFILWRTTTPNCDGLPELLRNKTFQSVFPLHEEGIWKKEHNFQSNWANWKSLCDTQPINQIRLYFGERLALYYAWLDWYTTMLIPAAICGFFVFLYGIATFDSSQVSKEICNAHTTIMCPRCDQRCPFWKLSDMCAYAKITQLFDHEVTIFFAMFMGIWATVFLELWKRTRIKVINDWDLFHWDEDEEELALGLIYNPGVLPVKYCHSFLRTGIVLLLGCIQINYLVAWKLCGFERLRTSLARENSFTVKMFTFQFFTMFTSITYIAFFLGRINGFPGNYVRIANKWRLEECHPSGCLTDLLMQMSIVMVLKQLLSTIMEYGVPILKIKWKKRQQRFSKDNIEDTTQHWINNYNLNDFDSYSLFNEFLEIAIQYGFTTIFVAAFPLAPLLALVINLFEIRLDAKKMVWLLKRPIPRKAKDIGIWLQILEVIGVLAIMGNGLVISFTSDFIPQQVYLYRYSHCLNQSKPQTNCLTGYVNNSLSVFYVKNFESGTVPLDDGSKLVGFPITYCRYSDYRNEHTSEYTMQFWQISAARLAFLLLFVNIVVYIKYLAAWFIPDVPVSVRNENLKKTYNQLQQELKDIAAKTPMPSMSDVMTHHLTV